MKIKFDDKQFAREMKNIMEYSSGFLDGVERGKYGMLQNVGVAITEILGDFIDVNARSNPQMLQHVYEWYQAGSKNERLFDIKFALVRNGIAFDYTFRQSRSIKDGSSVAFYDKAEIMERGEPVIIKPKKASILSFNVDGEQVYTSKPVEVVHPGGKYSVGSFEKTLEMFFSTYLTQSFIQVSGLKDYLSNPISYKARLNSGKINGRSAGIDTGYRWMVMAGVGNGG